METFDKDDILIKLDDSTKWVFMFYTNSAVTRYTRVLMQTSDEITVIPFGVKYNDEQVQTLPAASFKKAPQENFTFGDIIILGAEGSKWKFKGYVIDKVTVTNDYAEKNNWRGSSGDKTRLKAVRIDESTGSEIGEEQKFPSRLFGKD